MIGSVKSDRELATASLVERLSTRVLVVLTRAEQYRVQAKECAERAKLAPDPETKRTYERMELQWLILAKQAENEGGGF
jgi:hypothetical protein